MRSFAIDQYKLAVADELEDQQNFLKSLQNELDKLEKDEDNMKKDIASLENDIDDEEREIKELEAKIDLTNQGLLKHNASALTLTTEIEKDAAKEKQKELEKEKKQLEKSRSKAKDDISSYKAKIEKNNKGIEESEEMQASKKEEIVNQENVIALVQAKLDGIK